MIYTIPSPDRLPRTADHYQLKGKPAALIPGRCGVVYEPAPRVVPWTELLRNGKPISSRQFQALLYEQE
jgi:hypothetical protein